MDTKHNIQIKSSKRKSRLFTLTDKIKTANKLVKVLGLTCHNGASLDINPVSGVISYPAGCTVVNYDSRKDKQTHICNSQQRAITCLAYSPDGKLLATGESGHHPQVRLYDLQDMVEVCAFKGHQFNINCIAFSPRNNILVSVGSQHDMVINVWDYKKKCKIASNKVASQVNSLAFSMNGDFFVTAGHRHLKFWYLDTSKTKRNETVPLNGRSGILGNHKNSSFTGVVCSLKRDRTYAVSTDGLLCEIDEKRTLKKFIDLRNTSANCITCDNDTIYVGCSSGVVHMFHCSTLDYITRLPMPSPLGVQYNVQSSYSISESDQHQYADIIALKISTNSSSSRRLVCIGNDHSLYTWDVADINHIGLSRALSFHSSCLWYIENLPETENTSLPSSSFITCSSDDTIRIWNIGGDTAVNTSAPNSSPFNKDLIKVIYTDPEYKNLKEVKFNSNKASKNLEKNGVRVVKCCPRSLHMATGDRSGNIRVYEMNKLNEIKTIEAHDSEILCLEYTDPSLSGVNLLASAGRDRLLHVYDVDQNYGLVQTLDDHSSAITSVRFATDCSQLHMISCGIDKSLLFRSAQTIPKFEFILNRNLVSRTTLYDMDVDPTHKFVSTACQDRNVRIYNIKSGKQRKCYSGSSLSDGQLSKVSIDRSGSYIVTCCTNKSVNVIDFFSGEIVCSFSGHSETVTGVKFLRDCRHVISVSSDSCVFIWRLPDDISSAIKNRLCELSMTPIHSSKRTLKNDTSVSMLIDSINLQTCSPRIKAFTSTPRTHLSTPDVSTLPQSPRCMSTPITKNPRLSSDSPGNEFNRLDDLKFGKLPSWAMKKMHNSVKIFIPDEESDETDLDCNRMNGSLTSPVEVKDVVPVISRARWEHQHTSFILPVNNESVVDIVDDDDKNIVEEEDEFTTSNIDYKITPIKQSVSLDLISSVEEEEAVATSYEDDTDVIFYPPSDSSSLNLTINVATPIVHYEKLMEGGSCNSDEESLSPIIVDTPLFEDPISAPLFEDSIDAIPEPIQRLTDPARRSFTRRYFGTKRAIQISKKRRTNDDSFNSLSTDTKEPNGIAVSKNISEYKSTECLADDDDTLSMCSSTKKTSRISRFKARFTSFSAADKSTISGTELPPKPVSKRRASNIGPGSTPYEAGPLVGRSTTSSNLSGYDSLPKQHKTRSSLAGRIRSYYKATTTTTDGVPAPSKKPSAALKPPVPLLRHQPDTFTSTPNLSKDALPSATRDLSDTAATDAWSVTRDLTSKVDDDTAPTWSSSPLRRRAATDPVVLDVESCGGDDETALDATFTLLGDAPPPAAPAPPLRDVVTASLTSKPLLPPPPPSPPAVDSPRVVDMSSAKLDDFFNSLFTRPPDSPDSIGGGSSNQLKRKFQRNKDNNANNMGEPDHDSLVNSSEHINGIDLIDKCTNHTLKTKELLDDIAKCVNAEQQEAAKCELVTAMNLIRTGLNINPTTITDPTATADEMLEKYSKSLSNSDILYILSQRLKGNSMTTDL